MVWLTVFFPFGYPLVNLAQYYGGILGLLAVFELGRLAGLSRAARLLAVALFLGMANVFLQFATSQSDLFTAGLTAAGSVFVWRSIRRPTTADAILAGIAFGLALGAKGTVLYGVPGLLGWVGFLLWRHRGDFRGHSRSLALVGATALLVGGWKYADNWGRFGNPFAPPEEIARMQCSLKSGFLTQGLFSGGMHAWQLFQANSNPRFFAPVLAPAERVVRGWLERSSPAENLSGDFKNLRVSYEGQHVYEDIVSFGVVAVLMVLVGIGSDIWRVTRDPAGGAGQRLAMAFALGAFFFVFFIRVVATVWDFRLFVIVAPFLAVVGAAALPPRAIWRWAAPAAFLIVGLQIFTAVDLQSRNVIGGWRALSHPDQFPNLPLWKAVAGQPRELPPSVRTVALALPLNDWLAPYFRQPHERRYRFVPLDSVKSAGTPADYLRQSGFDALITGPDTFPSSTWEGVEAKANGETGSFARVCFYRRR